MLVDCESCHAVVDATEIAAYDYPDDFFPGDTRVTLLRCPKCSRPLLMQQYMVDESDAFSPSRIFPPPHHVSHLVPEEIKAAYIEAMTCHRAKAYTAAAIMCRKTLEGICAAHDVSERNLVTSLSEMKKRGIIENRLFEWAEALRLYGNEAAHDVQVRVTPEDSSDLVDFTNALLEYLFTFRDKFEKFKQRRANKGGDTQD